MEDTKQTRPNTKSAQIKSPFTLYFSNRQNFGGLCGNSLIDYLLNRLKFKRLDLGITSSNGVRQGASNTTHINPYFCS